MPEPESASARTNINDQQAWSRVSGQYKAWRTQPTWLRRLATAVILVILLGFTAFVLVSSFVIGIVIAIVGAAAFGIATLIRRIRGDNPPSQGRKNVRVIVRQHP